MPVVHKIKLKPNNKQKTYFAKCSGVARFAYNWALEQWQKQYAKGNKPSEASLRRQLNAIKAESYPWMLEVTKVASQQAIKNLGNAFKRFFNGQGKYPCFKKKGFHDSFRADNGPAKQGADAVKISNKKIKLPRIGWIRMREVLRFQGQVMSVTISRRADSWYAAISVEGSKLPYERKNHGSVGIDLGIKALATCSNGQIVIGPKAHSALLQRLRRISKSLSRKVKGSRNFNKAKQKLAKLYARISNIRADSLHKLTTELVLNYSQIGIEDLNVKGIAANKKLSRHIMDQSFYEFRRQLTYKSTWYDTELVVIDRFYPSSKTCHVCGYRNENLKLKDRSWQCICGKIHDRDLNAALNIKKFMSTVSSTGIDACGAESAGVSDVLKRETMPCMKQEFNFEQV